MNTPEEIAKELLLRLDHHDFSVAYVGTDTYRMTIAANWFAPTIASAIRDAYDRAAKTVEGWEGFRQYEADACVAAIRALKGNTPHTHIFPLHHYRVVDGITGQDCTACGAFVPMEPI